MQYNAASLLGKSTLSPIFGVREIRYATVILFTHPGWGLTIPGDWNSQSDILQQAKMPVVDDQECKRSHQGAGIPITEAMFCVGHGKTSSVTTCNTDSGGPIVCRQRGGRWFLQGVVSWGLGGCKAGYYSVNARVSQFTRWINSWTQ